SEQCFCGGFSDVVGADYPVLAVARREIDCALIANCAAVELDEIFEEEIRPEVDPVGAARLDDSLDLAMGQIGELIGLERGQLDDSIDTDVAGEAYDRSTELDLVGAKGRVGEEQGVDAAQRLGPAARV